MDLLDSLGLDDSKTSRRNSTDYSAKKSSFLNELFGNKGIENESKSNNQSLTDIFQDSTFKTSKSAPNIVAPNESQIIAPIGTNPIKRPTRRHASNLVDPLGFFASPQKVSETNNFKLSDDPSKENYAHRLNVDSLSSLSPQKQTNKIAKQISTSVAVKSDEHTNLSKQNSKETDALPDWLKGSVGHRSEPQVVSAIEKENIDIKENEPNQITSANDISNQAYTVGFETAISSIQQQESQLIMALQLKKYEEKLVTIQKNQHNALTQQEKYLNAILEQQNEQQKRIEEQLRLQQERINSHLQAVLLQPTVSPTLFNSPLTNDSAKNEITVKLLENEKNQLEQVVDNLKQKHREELQILEDSFRKQITLLNESLQATEQRLKSDIDSNTQYYSAKITQLNDEIETMEHQHKQKIIDLNDNHKEEIKSINERHQQYIEDLKKEHLLSIENIRETKLLENNAINDVGSYSKNLNEAIVTLGKNSQNIHEIQSRMREQFDAQMFLKESMLKTKEDELNSMYKNVEKQKEFFENERKRLLFLVESLEVRLREQGIIANEAKWSADEQTSKLAAKEAALERETQHARDLAERERLHIETMRQQTLAEYEKLKLELTEEKLALAAEKSQHETKLKLQNGFAVSKSHAEVEAAIQVAQETMKKSDEERAKYIEEKRYLEIERKRLEEREQRLKIRESELNELLLLNEQKSRESERILAEAKFTEQKYNERLKTLQSQLSSLSVREKKLAEDKAALSREKIAFHSSEKDGYQKCSLCAIGNEKTWLKNDNSNTAELGPPSYYRNSIDADILRLKVSIDNAMSETAMIPTAESVSM